MSASDIQNVRDFQQKVLDYEVYGGSLRILLHPEKNTPIVINNQLKPIEELNTQINYGRAEAAQIAQKIYADPIAAEKNIVKDQPVAAYTEGASGELAWVVNIYWVKERKYQGRSVLISTATGKVLSEIDLITH